MLLDVEIGEGRQVNVVIWARISIYRRRSSCSGWILMPTRSLMKLRSNGLACLILDEAQLHVKRGGGGGRDQLSKRKAPKEECCQRRSKGGVVANYSSRKRGGCRKQYLLVTEI